MLKAIIFDFDGIIVDTEKKRFVFLRNSLKKYGYVLMEKDFHKILGRKTNTALKELFPNMDNELIVKIAEERRKELDTTLINAVPITGVVNLLIFLKDEYSIALCTGSKRKLVKKYLKHYNLNDYFSLLVTGDDYESSKEDPEGFKLTLRKLNCKPSEAIIIEDSRVGIVAAKKSYCKAYALRNKYNKDQIKEADKIFKNYKEMLKYFKSLS